MIRRCTGFSPSPMKGRALMGVVGFVLALSGASH